MTPQLLPPDDARAPKFWAYETGGELCKAVERYLKGEALTQRDLQLIRLYIVQWIDSPVWMLPHEPTCGDGREVSNLRGAARRIRTRGDVDRWTRDANNIGIDPF